MGLICGFYINSFLCPKTEFELFNKGIGMHIPKIFSILREDPYLFTIRCVSLIYLTYLKRKKNFQTGKGLILKGIPEIQILGNGKITIADNVTLYSTRRQYFAHMSSPVRIFVEKNATVDIGSGTRINGATIHARKKISIGKNCLIAANTSILDSNGHSLCLYNPDLRINSQDSPKTTILEDSVWVGLNSIILKGVRVGYGSVIGAGCVVNDDIPPLCLAVGNPARIIKKY